MTDIGYFKTDPVIRKQAAQNLPLPAPVPFSAPVLISDCASPLAGETILSLIWRRMDGTQKNARTDSPGVKIVNHSPFFS